MNIIEKKIREPEKVLLVTGASSDIGTELINRQIDNYRIILAHYNNSSLKLQELKEQYKDKIILLKADFSNAEEVNYLIKQICDNNYYPDDIIHFPALNSFNKKFVKYNWEEDYRKGIEIAIHSIVEILKSCLPVMSKRRRGKVVLMLSSYTLNNPPKYQTAYVMVKYALLGLVKSLSVEYADKGVTVNGVSPDMIDTKFLSDLPEIVINKNIEENPLGRILTVDDVVPTIEFLLSDGADTVTGQNIGISLR